MARFLIDVNLPYYFALWRGDEFVHVRDLDDGWSDQAIWNYAREKELVIVSKDADFFGRAMLDPSGPKVIHVRVGNLKMADFHAVVSEHWPFVRESIGQARIINLYADRVELIGERR